MSKHIGISLESSHQNITRPIVQIYTLGRFEIINNDKLITFAGNLPRKPLSLLKAIIAFGGHYVTEKLLRTWKAVLSA